LLVGGAAVVYLLIHWTILVIGLSNHYACTVVRVAQAKRREDKLSNAPHHLQMTKTKKPRLGARRSKGQVVAALMKNQTTKEKRAL